VTRRKTTVYLDPDVLTATKVLAAAREQSESQVVEDALRAYLRGEKAAAARNDLRALMERVGARAELDDEEAMALAVEEVRSVRSTRRSNRSA
jgi:predicted transcriptional regulator